MPSAPRSILTCKISSVLSIPATDERHIALFLLLASLSLNSLLSLSLFVRTGGTQPPQPSLVNLPLRWTAARRRQ